MRAEHIIQAPVVDERSSFERQVKKSNPAFDRQTVGRELCDVETTRWARFKNEIRRAVIVDELANVSRLEAKRAKTAHISIRAGDSVTDGDGDPREFVAGVVQVGIHYEAMRGVAVKDLRPFQYPMRPQVLGVGQLKGPPPKSPMDEIARRVAAHIAFIRIEALSAVLAKPVPRVPEIKDSAAVRLDAVSLRVVPDFARTDGMRGRGPAERWADEGGEDEGKGEYVCHARDTHRTR